MPQPILWIVFNYRAFETLSSRRPKAPKPVDVISLAEQPQGLVWSDIIPSLPERTLVIVESFALVGDSPKAIAQLVQRFVSKGHSICFAREDVTISSAGDEAYKLLQALPDPLEAKLARQREGIERAKDAGKSNWINPDQAMLDAINQDRKGDMPIYKICEKHGLTKRTYYKWKEKGFIK